MLWGMAGRVGRGPAWVGLICRPGPMVQQLASSSPLCPHPTHATSPCPRAALADDLVASLLAPSPRPDGEDEHMASLLDSNAFHAG